MICDLDHAEIVGYELLVARGDAAEVHEAADEALNDVARPIRAPVNQHGGMQAARLLYLRHAT